MNVIDKIDKIIGEEVIEEGSDAILKTVASAVSGMAMMAMRTTLEGIFKKKDINFVTSPYPMYMIKHKGKTIIIINKRYVDDPDVVEGEYGIGYL